MFNEEFESLPYNTTLYVDEQRSDFQFKHRVKQIIDKETMDTLNQVTETVSNALKAFLTANIFVSLLSAGLLQYLWGLINTL